MRLLLPLFLLACNDAELTGKINETCFSDADGDGYGDELSELIGCTGDESGWVQEKGDCDDGDASIHPGAGEVCDDIDNDCNGSVDDGVTSLYYADADGDGHGDADAPTQACYEAAGLVQDALDCDDTDAAVHPGAEEVCNEIDDDCDGTTDEGVTTTFFADLDGDGWGDDGAEIEACALPADAADRGGDCDDGDATSNPDETEICDEADNDCDGMVDEDSFNAGLWYEDRDGDSFGDPASSTLSCVAPDGFVADDTDCDDLDGASNPDGTEVCDGADNDCDGTVDEDAADLSAWYADADGDHYGDPATVTWACDAPASTVTDATDCDDANAGANPGASEVCDAVDNDCDGSVDEGSLDLRTFYADADGDGFGDAATAMTACDLPAGYVDNDDDCDDGNADVWPGATEVCDGADNDCDGNVDEHGATGESTWYTDADSDGYGDPATAVTACDAPAGTIATGSDCDDTETLTHPGAGEQCDGVDNDCDGSVDEGASDSLVWYEDRDGDAFGDATRSVTSCDAPDGFVDDASDCDDLAAETYPGAPEICDNADNDCDTDIDEDAIDAANWYTDSDGDSYGDPATAVMSCDALAGQVANDDDCDDADNTAHPGGTEVCDGADNDCDGSVDEVGALGGSTWYLDADGDGFGNASMSTTACDAPASYVALGTDCADSDATINPGETDYCDGTDNDCSGDEDGLVTFTRSSTGAVSDLSSTWASGTKASPKAVTLSTSGTTEVCPGTYYVAITASATTTVIEGPYGAADTILLGGDSSRVITATGDITLTDLTITDGSTTANGGGLLVSGGNDATLTSVIIQDSAAVKGGNLGFTGGGTLTLTDVQLLNGDASSYGGALWITGSTATIDGLLADGNQADSGGGLYVYNTTLTATDAEITNNSSSTNGGGLYLTYGASVTLSASDVAYNSGSDDGGGAYVNGSALTINSLTNIHDNDASVIGGGVMLDGDADLTCTGSSTATAGIWGNTSLLAGGVYMTGAAGSVLTSTRCDWTSTSDNSLYDIIISIFYYNYGDNQTFTCSGATCS